MNPGLDLNEARRTHAAYKQATEEGLSFESNVRGRPGILMRVVELLGDVPPQTVQNRIKPLGGMWRALALHGDLGTKPVLPGFSLRSTSTQIGANGETERTWVRQAPAPAPAFVPPDDHSIIGVSALVDGDDRVIQRWIKTSKDRATADVIEACKATFDAYTGRAELIEPPATTDADLLSVYPIADMHLGLLAHKAETGENYDLKIGAERLRSCMTRLVSQSPASQQALILNLGDWTHQDDSRNLTPASGNALDVDGRYHKVIQTGVRLMIDCIELALAKHFSVLVRNLPGNHDPHASFALTIALGCFFSNNPRVTIDDSPSEWFFHQFGETLLGAHHGHKAKPERMAMTMACECRELWGRTKYHHILAGHIHHESSKEIGDVRCETFQSLASRDAYHAGAGYTSGRSLSSITFHREEGEIGRHRINVAR